MTEEQKVEYLETPHGVFTNNLITGQTAQEVYDEWLENKDKPTEPQPTVDDKIIVLQQQVEVLSQEKLELQVELEETKTKLSETEARVNATEDAVLELMMK